MPNPKPSKWAKKRAQDLIFYTNGYPRLKVTLAEMAKALDAAAEEERERAIRAAYKFAHEYSINVTEDAFVKRVLDKLGR